jgi:site-specific recombinase XerD
MQRPTCCHGLRHSFATNLYRETGDVLLVREALGHRSIASTVVYARPEAARLRALLG